MMRNSPWVHSDIYLSFTSGYIARKLSTPAKSRQPDQQRDPICPNIRVQKKRAHVQGATSEIY